MPNIFSNSKRSDASHKKHSESTFKWLDRVNTSRGEAIRRILEDWFSNYPSKYCIDLRRKLKADFVTGFYELFSHEYFARAGFQLLPEPKLLHTARQPDFEVSGKGGKYYLEDTCVRDQSQEEAKQERVKGIILV